MSKGFYNVTVSSVIKETEDCVSVTIDVPQNLQEDFSFIPGQYLTFETSINGEKVRRSYSLCSAPHQKIWKVAIKKVPQGKFSTYANDILKSGDKIDVMPPVGNFKILTKKDNSKDYVAFAAGSGITPILSMISSVMHEEPQSTFTLFYGSRNSESIIFREALDNLKDTYMDRLSIHHILSKENVGSSLFYGRINQEKCNAFSKTFFDAASVAGYYLCGPAPMIFEIKDTLLACGVEENKIHFELFSTEDIPIKKIVEDVKKEDFDPTVESKVTIILDEDEMELGLSFGGLSILDAALKAGADLPYACKGGVCSTCKAKVIKGEVSMDLNYALEPDELENGFVLTCQSHPRTPEVTVDFDEA